jgi:short-subunit dehydrogenase
VFGSLGYPGYVAYSASKFAIRGFTEALRRELSSTTVKVHYLAPRATRTPINSSAIERMNAKLGVAMDSPETVARAAVSLLETGRPSAVVGWPEKFFVRLNALFPRVVDRAVSQQLPTIEHYAQRRNAEPELAPMPRRQLS